MINPKSQIPNPKFQNNKKAGFTLLEVSMAITILLVGVVGIASLIPVALNANARAKNISTIAMLAEREAEEMKKNIYISSSNWDGIVSTSLKASFGAPYDNFKWQRTVTESPTGLKEARLTISWQEGSVPRSEEFIFYVAKR